MKNIPIEDPEYITKGDLVEFLRQNLSISCLRGSGDWYGNGSVEVALNLIVDGKSERISTDYFDLPSPNRGW